MVNSKLDYIHQCSIAIEDLIHDIKKEMDDKESIYYLDADVSLSVNNEPYGNRRFELSKLQEEIVSKIKAIYINNINENNYLSFIFQNNYNNLYWLYKKMRLLYLCYLLNAIFQHAANNAMRTKLLPHDFTTISNFYDWERDNSILSGATAREFFSDIKDTFIEMVKTILELDQYNKDGLKIKNIDKNNKNFLFYSDSINSKERYIQALLILPEKTAGFVKVSKNNVNLFLVKGSELRTISSHLKLPGLLNPFKFVDMETTSKLKGMIESIPTSKYKIMINKVCKMSNLQKNKKIKIFNDSFRQKDCKRNSRAKTLISPRTNYIFKIPKNSNKTYLNNQKNTVKLNPTCPKKKCKKKKLNLNEDIKKKIFRPLGIEKLHEIVKTCTERNNFHTKAIFKGSHKPSVNLKKNIHEKENINGKTIKDKAIKSGKLFLSINNKQEQNIDKNSTTNISDEKYSYSKDRILNCMKQVETSMKLSNQNKIKNNPKNIDLEGVNNYFNAKKKSNIGNDDKNDLTCNVPIEKCLKKPSIRKTSSFLQNLKQYPTNISSKTNCARKEVSTEKKISRDRLKDISNSRETISSMKKENIETSFHEKNTLSKPRTNKLDQAFSKIESSKLKADNHEEAKTFSPKSGRIFIMRERIKPRIFNPSVNPDSSLLKSSTIFLNLSSKKLNKTENEHLKENVFEDSRKQIRDAIWKSKILRSKFIPISVNESPKNYSNDDSKSNTQKPNPSKPLTKNNL